MTEALQSASSIDPRKGRVALCLSGGGFRATLFHLGVIKALRACSIDGGRAIDKVDHVYAVSGGSIIAGHMLRHWEDYCDPDEARFNAMADKLIEFTSSNIRNRVLRRWFLQALPRRLWQALKRNPASVRTQLLQKSYEGLLGAVNIGDCYPERRRVPRFHFLATDFKTGELCAFSGINLEVEDHKGQCTPTGCGNVKLTAAVAASSAFPPLFPPLLLPPSDLSYPPGMRFREALLLSDGGVFDNLGIEKLQKRFARDEGHPRIALISDAGAPFRVTARRSYSRNISRNIRASDILMNRISDFTARSIESMTRIDDVVIAIGARVRNSSLSCPNQQLLRLVRTDLDIFDAEISRLLIAHGEAVTLASLRKIPRIELPTGCELELVTSLDDPAPSLDGPAAPGETGADLAAEASRVSDQIKAVAARASTRSLASLFFDRKDWLVVSLFYALIALVFLGPTIVVGYNLKMRGEKEERARIEKELKDQGYESRLRALRQQLDKREALLAAAGRAEGLGDYASLRGILMGRLPDQTSTEKPTPPTKASVPPASDLPDALSRDVSTSANGYRGRVFIQFAGTLKREEIVTLNTMLRSRDWNVQGASGERTPVAKGTHEVRYGGDNEADALRLAAAIDKAGILTRPVRTNKVSIIGPSDLEIWISR